MYKDIDKRRKTTRERVRRYRDKQKALQGVTSGRYKGVTYTHPPAGPPLLDADGNRIYDYD